MEPTEDHGGVLNSADPAAGKLLNSGDPGCSIPLTLPPGTVLNYHDPRQLAWSDPVPAPGSGARFVRSLTVLTVGRETLNEFS